METRQQRLDLVSYWFPFAERDASQEKDPRYPSVEADLPQAFHGKLSWRRSRSRKIALSLALTEE